MATTKIFRRLFSGDTTSQWYDKQLNQIKSFTTTTVCRGITFDGRFFWICSDAPSGVTRPKIIQYDWINSALVREFNYAGLGAGTNLIDLAWDGRGGFYIITEHPISGNINLQHAYDLGVSQLNLVLLPATAGAVSCRRVGGKLFIYVVYTAAFHTRLKVYDMHGNEISDTGTLIPANSDTDRVGILATDRALVVHSGFAFTGSNGFNDYLDDFSGGTPIRGISKEVNSGGDQPTMAWDGYWVYQLNSS